MYSLSVFGNTEFVTGKSTAASECGDVTDGGVMELRPNPDIFLVTLDVREGELGRLSS